MVDPNTFAGNFFSLLDQFQTKKPIEKNNFKNEESSKQNDNLLKSDNDGECRGGVIKQDRGKQRYSRQGESRNQENRFKREQNLSKEKSDRRAFNKWLQHKRRQSEGSNNLDQEKIVKSVKRKAEYLSDNFCSVLDGFDKKLICNEDTISKQEVQNTSENCSPGTNGCIYNSGINHTKDVERGVNSKRRIRVGYEEKIKGDERNFNRESENSVKKRLKPMGYKFLESLLDKDVSFVLTTLASPRTGFQELVNDLPIRPDLLMLIIKVLDKIVKSEANQLKVQILSSTFKPEFIGEIKKFVSIVCVEENRERLLGMNTFFVNILNVLDNVVNLLPSTMNEKMKSTLNALNLSMKSLRDEHRIEVKEQLFEQLKELTDQVTSYIEHEKVNKEKTLVKKKEIPPPNSYRDIPLIPTKKDFMTDGYYLRQNIVKGSYSNVDHYLDVQFRLLREDFIAPLRDGIFEYVESLSNPFSKRRYSNVRIYPKVKFVNCYKTRDVFGFYIKFDCDKKLPKYINWEYNKRFMNGSLLLLSDDNFQTFYLATVAERNIEKLKNGLLFVTFVPGTDVPEYLFEPEVFFVMAESEVYYEAYKHVLSALQRMNDNNFPMKRYIVDVDTVNVPPAYVIDNSNYKISKFNINLLDDNSWPCPEELNLNPSQHRALKSALTNEFVVIQGPPGTGKTFLALKITEIMLKNAVSSNTPIIVICYTNHALDQFLEGILKYTDKIIRIGMQSQNEALKKFNLEEVRKKMKQARNLNLSAIYRDTMQSKFDIQSKLQMVEEKFDELSNPEGVLDLIVLKSIVSPHQFNELSDPNQLLNWLFWYDDNEFHQMKTVEEPGVSVFELPVAQNLDELPPENSHPQVEESTVTLEEEIEELDDEENARRLADMTEDDFFEDDFIQGVTHDKKIFYSLKIEDIDMKINAIHHAMKCTKHRNKNFKNFFDKQCSEQIIKLRWQQQFLQRYLTNFKSFVFDPARYHRFQNVSSVWEIRVNDRWEYYTTWVYLYTCQLKQIVQHLTKMYQDLLMKLHELRQLEDLRFVQTADVVGLTTSGAAKRRVLLENLGTKIVIVEEAAEVLEAHIATSLAPTVQQVILIGDHKQLKPNPAVFKLAKKYNMDCSLFERMINNGLGCSVLNEQHRMRPEIASLITPTIYDHLANHPSTFDRPKVRGIDKFVFFLSHNKPEDQLPDSTSKQNTHEADILMELCKYLLLNEYKPEEITILATYIGQVWYMRKKKREMGTSFPEMKAVRITPVDNFQGEENRIILLSLVRSNKENKIGFLGTENRVCVALSRAKEGLYIVGNMDNLTNSSTIWPRIKAQLENINAFGHKLLLRCERHPDQITNVSKMADIKQIPKGGCSLMCKTELNCGHICPEVCHIIDCDHGFYRCNEKCKRPPCDVEGHKCPLLCWEDCKPCIISVKKNLLCGHTAVLKCHEEPADYRCREEVSVIHPVCGHEIVKHCYEDVNDSRCTNKCTIRLPCGHACVWKCHINDDPDHIKYKCMKECVNKFNGCRKNLHPCRKRCYEECGDCQVLVWTKLPCEHNHEIPCSTEPEDFKCTRNCKKTMSCGHKCKAECWVKCDPSMCKELVDKKAKCGHTMRKMKCGEDPMTRMCKQDCMRLLPCQHPCPDKCCNNCNYVVCRQMVDSIVAPKCGHPIIKIPCHLNNNDLNGGSDEILELCQGPCGKKMSCGHQCKGTCGQCMQGRLHVPCGEKCNKTLVCGHECKSKCSVLCPPCLDRKCLIRCNHRSCFVPHSKNHECFSRCYRSCDKKCLWACEHYQCERRCWDECNRPPCLEPCPLLLGCGHACMGYCGEPCPRVCAICNEDNATPGHRYVFLEDCKHIVDSQVMDRLVAEATRNNIFRLMLCPLSECEMPVANTLRYRNVYIGFRRQVMRIENIVKYEEVRRLLRIHSRWERLLGSKPTASHTMNMVMRICSGPFPNKPLDQKELGRLIISCVLQPLAERCLHIKGRIRHSPINQIVEQRLMFRLEYLASLLMMRLDQISYNTIVELELIIAQILRLSAEDNVDIQSWFEVTPYTWREDLNYPENRMPRISSTLRIRDSAKQWSLCDRQHLINVCEDVESCVVCKEEEENQRRLESASNLTCNKLAARLTRPNEVWNRPRQRQNEEQHRYMPYRKPFRNQGPLVTDYRSSGGGRGHGWGRGNGGRRRGWGRAWL